jgi:hypothetical protein
VPGPSVVIPGSVSDERSAVSSAPRRLQIPRVAREDNKEGFSAAGTKSYASQINDQQGKTTKVTYKIDFTPPKKSVGKITLYLAGIGGSGDPSNDSPYTSKLTLSPK